MIDFKELNPRNYELDLKTECHLLQLFNALLKLQKLSGINFIITSALRSQAFQNVMIATGKTTAIHSKHVIGAAADILDTHGELAEWCTKNEWALEECELWCEDFESIKVLARKQGVAPWCHFQTLPPGSGKRFFIP